MSSVEEVLKKDFPEATEAECKRFVRACQDDKKDADAVKEEAEKLLEHYLDWRSCHGLDCRKTDATPEEPTDDAGDWQYAVKKALEVEESMKRAKELEKKPAEAAKMTKEEKVEANYDIDINDEKPSENEDGKEERKSGGDEDEATKEKDASATAKKDNEDGDVTKGLSQFIFLHKSKDGTPIKDKSGHSILHVMPAMINRKVATAETYGLAVSFYLDSKLDRSSDEKMTVFLDVRAGEGWPNPVAFRMINFVRKVMNMLQAHYPERCECLVLFPVPRAAMGVWGAIKRVFGYGIMGKVVLVPGPALRDSPLPKERLEEYIDGEVLDLSEHVRLDNFKIL
jgi:hypothetical protein